MKKRIGHLEKKRRKYRKMLRSLSNKMQGPNQIWWDSLSQKAQYSVLFDFITDKQNTHFKFKHFLQKHKPKYKPSKINARNAMIEHLIDE